jgi:hypothetical protein
LRPSQKFVLVFSYFFSSMFKWIRYLEVRVYILYVTLSLALMLEENIFSFFGLGLGLGLGLVKEYTACLSCYKR